ncbi:putative nuclease HARBI1 [Macrobrachium nipponense]|uniref:putative nuclease HARBI1 n=1 Tax=Macrobrachium nipponense TaxID=159736 RepID=UPI0030C7D11A
MSHHADHLVGRIGTSQEVIKGLDSRQMILDLPTPPEKQHAHLRQIRPLPPSLCALTVAQNTITYIVPETCRAIVTAYRDEELEVPQTPAAWQEVARGFEEWWNFPHVTGAKDGKHIRLCNPSQGGMHYFNYKKFYYMILLAIADASYKFLYVDVGAIGSESDVGVFVQTYLGEMLLKQEANLSQPEALLGQAKGSPLDYFLVGDDALPLWNYLKKPFPQRAFPRRNTLYNSRLSRVRRTVENTFRILAKKFQVFHTAICLKPDCVKTLVLATCILHNIIIRKSARRQEGDQELPTKHAIIPGSWRSDLCLIAALPTVIINTATRDAKEQRNILKEYFSSP